MKRNKIAAGALALALGFGAVAPVHAAEDNPSPESVKELINAMRNERENLDSNSEKIMDALGKAQEIQRERQRAAQDGEGTVEDNNPTGETTTPSDDKDGSKEDKETSEDGKDGSKKDKETSEDGKDGSKEGTKPSDDNNNKDENEEIKKGPYDTEEEATEAAKKALKAAPTMNEYVVYKDAEGKFYFYIRNNSTDGEGKAEEGKEVVATGKKDDSKESSSPARQADDNAKTGVTGLVSVASILGAASVAYVASKKRD